MNKISFDLLSLVETGGCSAKLAPGVLSELLNGLKQLSSPHLLVGNDTCDDALVYKLDNNTAIIQTTDFFPPLCSDAYSFGEIAAANALSDIYAMGGKAITALNIVMFPSDQVDVSVLKAILEGGADMVARSGAVLAGGHTIDGPIPVYGLSVTGVVHPDCVISNNKAEVGDVLILTKGIGTGTLNAGLRVGELEPHLYDNALFSMKQLNQQGAELMQRFKVHSATDVTGFSLLGHALEMAAASKVHFKIYSEEVPLLEGAYAMTELGCIPGASFRNLKYIEHKINFSDKIDYNRKMLCVDAQTSGGLLIAVKEHSCKELLEAFLAEGYEYAAIIGEVQSMENQTFQLEVL